MITKKITTRLVGRTEIFNMMALAESLQLPLLLLGPPGVGKTACAKDYSTAIVNGESSNLSTFILQVHGSTRTSEVRGNINLKALLSENEYVLSGGAETADIVVIDEIDKGSSSVQNCMLGIMNEKKFFNGDKEVPCNWKLFIGTCNKIPTSTDSPHFWDRFILQSELDKLSGDDIVAYYKKGGLKNIREVDVRIPTMDEIDAVIIPPSYLEKLILILKNSSQASDRTIIQAPLIAKAIHLIWGVSIDKALVKAVTIIGKERGKVIAKDLQSQLQSKEVTSIISKLSLARNVSTADEFRKHMDEIVQNVLELEKSGKLTPTDTEELMNAIELTEKSSPFVNNTDSEYISGTDSQNYSTGVPTDTISPQYLA